MRTNHALIIIDLPEPYQDINFFRRPKGWNMTEHDHPYYQIILVTNGILILSHNNNNYSLKRGQLCIIPPGHYHSLKTVTGYEQFGINCVPEKDRRGVISLLTSYIDDFIVLDTSELLDVLPGLSKECNQLTNLSKLKIANILDSMLFNCVEKTSKGNEIDFRNRLITYLNKNLSNKINLNDLSKEVAISRSQLERLTNKEFGCGPIDVYNRLRINRACSLLIDSNLNIESISELLGFYDLAHFSHFFKQKTKISPSKYRKLKNYDYMGS